MVSAIFWHTSAVCWMLSVSTLLRKSGTWSEEWRGFWNHILWTQSLKRFWIPASLSEIKLPLISTKVFISYVPYTIQICQISYSHILLSDIIGSTRIYYISFKRIYQMFHFVKEARGLFGFLIYNLNCWSDSFISKSPSKERQKHIEVKKSAAGEASTWCPVSVPVALRSLRLKRIWRNLINTCVIYIYIFFTFVTQSILYGSRKSIHSF